MGFMSGLLGDTALSSMSAGNLFSAAGSIMGGVTDHLRSSEEAKFMSANAKNAMREAENNAWLQREKAKKQASSQKAAFGASGIEVNEGSPLNVLAETDAEGEVAAADALYQGKVNKMQWDVKKKSAKQRGRKALFGSLGNLVDPLGLNGVSNFTTSFMNKSGS